MRILAISFYPHRRRRLSTRMHYEDDALVFELNKQTKNCNRFHIELFIRKFAFLHYT